MSIIITENKQTDLKAMDMQAGGIRFNSMQTHLVRGFAQKHPARPNVAGSERTFHVSYSYDVGVRGRVFCLYVDQSFKLVGLSPEVLAELAQLEPIKLFHTRIILKDALANTRLQRLISDVLSVDEAELAKAGGYVKVPTQSGEPVMLSVFPCIESGQEDSSAKQRFARIRISYPKQPDMEVFSRAMRDLYELSASESKVLSLLVQGLSTKEIAHRLEVADSTLRTHLKRIFAKTQTRHQAELVSQVLLCDTCVIPNRFTQ